MRPLRRCCCGGNPVSQDHQFLLRRPDVSQQSNRIQFGGCLPQLLTCLLAGPRLVQQALVGMTLHFLATVL